MTETYQPVPSHNLPVAEDVPLAYLMPQADEDYPHELYVLDTPALQDRYVGRPLRFDDCSGESNVSDEQALDILQSELQRARESGIAIPEVKAGLPDGWHGNWLTSDVVQAPREKVLLLTERITPVAITAENVEAARQSAQKAIGGMVAYLSSSLDPERPDDSYFLTDPLRGRNYMFGTVPSGSEPDMYMFDTECLVASTAEARDGWRIPDTMGEIMRTASDFAELVGDPAIHDYAAQLMTEIDPEAQLDVLEEQARILQAEADRE